VLLLTAGIRQVINSCFRRQQLAWLGSDNAHLVCRVRELEHFKPELLEMPVSCLRWTIKDHVAFGKNDNAIEHHEDVGRRLVNGCDDTGATVCLSSHQLAYFKCSE